MALSEYIIEMLHITKEFPGIIANDDITLQLKKGEIHALLGENGAGKSTLMSVLFGMYQPEKGEIRKNGQVVHIKTRTTRTRWASAWCISTSSSWTFSPVLDNIILGVEPTVTPFGFLQKAQARRKVMELSERYGLKVDPDAMVEDITVGMQQRTEILKALLSRQRGAHFRRADSRAHAAGNRRADEDHEGIDQRGQVHPVHHPQARRDQGCGGPTAPCCARANTSARSMWPTTSKEELSEMMVGRKVQLRDGENAAQAGRKRADRCRI